VFHVEHEAYSKDAKIKVNIEVRMCKPIMPIVALLLAINRQLMKVSRETSSPARCRFQKLLLLMP
jgi:hypothetical protein